MYNSSLTIMADPGVTKVFTLGDSWQKLSDIYHATSSTTTITSGKMEAIGITITAKTNGAEVCFVQSVSELPSSGHPIAASGSGRFVGQGWVKRCYVKNATASSNCTMAITPEF